MDIFDTIIVGSGPAGLTAAIYTTRANLKTLLIAGVVWGGQLQLTTLVENYPGFPEGIQGPELMSLMRKQAERFKPEIVDDSVSSINFTSRPFKLSVGSKTFEGKSVIIATGADPKKIGVPGEEEFAAKGVSYCATCDGPFFKGKNIIVVGGGDTAMEDATFLTHFANSVTIVHRREELRASKAMQERARTNPKIKFLFNTKVKEIKGNGTVRSVVLFNDQESKTSEMPIDGVFVAIGHVPNSVVFKGIDVDEEGYIKAEDHYKTNVEGVFTAGDVHDRHYRQAITAAGYGCAAALEAERWLSSQK